MIAQANRIAFSSYQIAAPTQVASIQQAQTAINAQITTNQTIDTANDSLFSPINTLVGQYQTEFNQIDGNARPVVVEQNLIDATNRVMGNFFYPNQTNVTVTPLAPTNIWTQTVPFALSAAAGFPYSGAFSSPSVTGEIPLITSILSYVSDPGSSVLDPIVNNYITTLNAESAALSANTDTNSTNHTQNVAAANNITSVILPVLVSYLTSPVFATLQAAVTARQTFVNTRVSQLNTILGSISQNVTTGVITSSSGLYGQRYGYLNMRLNALNGSLSILAGQQAAYNAQSASIAHINATAATYFSILPTSGFQSGANGTQFVSLLNVNFLNPGDQVYIMADNQNEMAMSVKTIVGNAVTLNGPVPSKYSIANNVRLYKDIS